MEEGVIADFIFWTAQFADSLNILYIAAWSMQGDIECTDVWKGS